MPTLAAFSAQFTWIDWLVVIGYLVFTSWLGARMAGRQATIDDFFRGGRKLPWYAVSGSIVASEISALTFVSVPWVVFQPGGNLTYLQLGVFGSLFARIIVGYWLVPEFYKREIYSPFDYMHNQLGGRIRGLTTVLFVIKALLAQSSRIYLASEVIVVVLYDELRWLTQQLGLNELAWAIVIISAVSIVWTLFGGMRTVVWTDVALFACFTLGALVALGTVAYALPGGFAELLRVGWDAKQSGLHGLGLPLKESGEWGKFTFFDWSTSPTRTYTMWTAMIASTWGGIGAYGLDQTLAQRMFCCRNERDARWAMISSSVSQLVTFTVALVGVGLYAYYQSHPLSGEALDLFRNKGDRILPIFVVEVVPAGLKGMIIAAIFAAAISTMMGVLTATSQTSLAAFYNPLRQRWLLARGHSIKLTDSVEHAEVADNAAVRAEQRRSVRVSRLLVLFWGVMLALLSYYTLYIAHYYPSILDLGLAMAGYILGALLAGFLLSFFPLNVDSRGFMYAAPLSCMCVFALIWHQPWARQVCWVFAAVTVAIWVWQLFAERNDPRPRPQLVLPAAAQTMVLVLGLALMLFLTYYAWWDGGKSPDGEQRYVNVAFPWMVPLGNVIAFVWGYLLARRRSSPTDNATTEIQRHTES
jgi:Na+/proline symporter